VVYGAFVVVVFVAVALLVYRGAIAFRAPRALLSVESDVPAKVIVDGDRHYTSPVSCLELPPGKHQLVFKLDGNVIERSMHFEDQQHIDIRLRQDASPLSQ
jgi:hypothetical protein